MVGGNEYRIFRDRKRLVWFGLELVEVCNEIRVLGEVDFLKYRIFLSGMFSD